MRVSGAKLVMAAACLALLFAGCGSEQKVGSEKLLNFEEQQGAQALGRDNPTETEAPLTVGQTPTPTKAAKTAPPAATPVIFNVELVTNSPYYKPGNCIRISVGVSVRVTNNDNIPERSKGRSFTDKNGSFNSGLLKPGESWTWNFDHAATYSIIDQGLNFAQATLHVGQGSCGE